MPKHKPLRKRDILIFAVVIVAAALLVFGASQLIEHMSAGQKRTEKPEPPALVTEDKAPEAETDVPPETEAETEPPVTDEPETVPPETEPTETDPPETTPPETTTEDTTTEQTTTEPATTPAPTTSTTPATTPATTTAQTTTGLTMPADEGRPENAKTQAEIDEEIEELKDDYAANGYNNNIKNIVLIGVDKRQLGELDYFRDAGQSDTVMILSMNLKTKEYWLVSVNRDLAVPVENYSLIGESYGFVTEQIALAYAYGDGSRLSGRNVIKSLNYLLSDSLPFLGFIAAPMDIIGALADAVDGVPVEIVDDFTGVDNSWKKGTTVVLKGDDAERYIRARKYMPDNPYNSFRMTRQFTFCEAFIKKAKETMSAKQLVKTYEDVMNMTVTDIGKSDITKWILTLYDYEFKGFHRIDGVRREGELLHNAPFNDINLNEVDDILMGLYFKQQ